MKKQIKTKVIFLVICFCLAGYSARGQYKLEIDEQTRAEIGIWGQAWYQFVENGKNNGADLNDFMIRRFYFYFKGQVTQYFSFFAHIAADRIGQEGLSIPSLGLGSGLTARDFWITFKPSEVFMLQAGRMYIPFTRQYGTTSTKAMLITDLPFLQGGVRGSIFYASKVGRDDGITLWGNPFNGRVQYRFMVSEGVEGDNNPDDKLRYVGRIALNLLEPEKNWFNQGTYLGKKKVLSLGLGYDMQNDLTLSGLGGRNNRAWTADVFFDYPIGDGALTVESSYIDNENSTQQHNFSSLAPGDDAQNLYVQAGYLFAGKIGSGRIQVYVRYETIDVDRKEGTNFISTGLNYYIKGHDAKLSADYTHVEHGNSREHQSIATFQLTIGF